MQAEKLLHNLFEESSVIAHTSRLNCLMKCVNSVLHDGKLSLTAIARHLSGDAKVKNKIKSVDTLMGNQKLMRERERIYEIVSKTLLMGLQEILILVDWSSCASHENHMLKASVMMYGRSMTLYEEVHKEEKLGNFNVHKKFLERLKKKIPLGKKVIIETDAGFRTDWFKLVKEMGWDFIGRIRSNMHFRYEKKDDWYPCFSLFSEATGRVKYLGRVLLTKERSLPASMYIYHEKKQQNVAINKPKRKKKSGSMDASCSKGNKEPWLLVTSLSGSQGNAEQIIRRYRHRMRIEHEFRNTKNSQWGIGLSYCQTKTAERLEILLLIGYLAIFVLWLIGLAAEHKGLHYDYQANTIKNRRVLSLVYLGLQIILHDPDVITKLDILNAFKEVKKTCY